MRIAFYAPMKAPDDPTPSGDRLVARLLMQALELAGHSVQVVSRFSSRDGSGDYMRQVRLRDVGVTTGTRLIQRAEMLRPELRPAMWFTYHLYHKSPDWLGPGYCQAMGIPYVVAEASYAPKQAGGPWDMGHNAVAEALSRASLVVGLNSVDRACVEPLLPNADSYLQLRPFIDPEPYATAYGRRESARSVLARRFNIDPGRPWLVAVAMTRYGDKLDSYRQLGQALALLGEQEFQLIIAGDGEARNEVLTAMRPLGSRLTPLGRVAPETIPVLYSAADLCVWPAVNEAYGMAMLEAHAAGLPVVSSRTGGVPDIVEHEHTGLLVEPGDVAGFAEAVRSLLVDPHRRRAMGQAAFIKIGQQHNIGDAALVLDKALKQLNAIETSIDLTSFGF